MYFLCVVVVSLFTRGLIISLYASEGAPDLPAGAKLVFSDDFNRDELGKGWIFREGENWKVRQHANYPAPDGALVGSGNGAIILYSQPVGQSVRLEYTTWSENAGDRSALLCVPADFTIDGYFFGFGSYGGTKNQFFRKGKNICADSTENLPVKGKKQRVVVEKNGFTLRMFADGRKIFNVLDEKQKNSRGTPDFITGKYVGFYIWESDVFFDDVKIYRLPEEEVKEVAGINPTVKTWQGFEGETIGKPPQQVTPKQGGNCSVLVTDKIINFAYKPHPDGQSLVPDNCLELAGISTENTAGITLPFAPLKNGLVEFDLLAESYEGNCASLSLIGANGQPSAIIDIDQDGVFNARTPAGKQRLLDTIEHQYRFTKTRLYLQPRRWFTVRLEFNAKKGNYRVALVNLCNFHLINGPESLQGGLKWLTLGEDIPFLHPTDTIKGLSLTTAGKVTLCVDNIIIIGPYGDSINNQPTYLPARELLGLTYPERMDPRTLEVYSLRNILGYPDSWRPKQEITAKYQKGPEREFTKAGDRYSRIIIRQAFLDETRQMIERIGFYLSASDYKNTLQGKLSDVSVRIIKTENSLEELYQVFAYAYLDSVNTTKLQESFPKAADALESELTLAENEAQALLEKFYRRLPGGDAKFGSLIARKEKNAVSSWKDGKFRVDGKPVFLFPPLEGNPVSAEMLEMLNFAPVSRVTTFPFDAKPKDYFDWARIDKSVSEDLFGQKLRQGTAIAIGSPCFVHDCQFYTPKWWMEENQGDPDIFFQDKQGRPVVTSGQSLPYTNSGVGALCRLNYWNPKVKEFTQKSFRELARGFAERCGANRIAYLNAGGESQLDVAGSESGFNKTAVTAFQAYLKEKYGNIKTLNLAWGNDYESFEEISPRFHTTFPPSGLTYEFENFRQLSYFNYFRDDIIKPFKENLPEVPFAIDFQNYFWWSTPINDFDLTRLFETFDIVGYHTYHPKARIPMFRMLDSLSKAYNKSAGNLEWGTMNRLGELFEEKAYKGTGLKNLFMAVAWGEPLWPIWYGMHPNWSDGANWTDPWVGNIALRYSAAFIPLAISRASRIGDIALNNPTLIPRVAMLEATSSWLNFISVREKGLYPAAQSLENDGWNYSFLFERALLEGKQTLKDVQVLIVPLGVCAPPELVSQIERWVKQGGILLTLGPVGLYDQYGQPTGSFFKRVFANVKWKGGKGFLNWKLTNMAGKPIEKLTLVKNLDKGKVIVLTAADPFPQKEFLKLMNENGRRDFYTAERDFHIVVRENKEARYLFIVNQNYYQKKEGTIMLQGEYTAAKDLSLPLPFPVSIKYSGGNTSFKLQLAPVEGAVIEFQKK